MGRLARCGCVSSQSRCAGVILSSQWEQPLELRGVGRLEGCSCRTVGVRSAFTDGRCWERCQRVCLSTMTPKVSQAPKGGVALGTREGSFTRVDSSKDERVLISKNVWLNRKRNYTEPPFSPPQSIPRIMQTPTTTVTLSARKQLS